MKDLKLIRFPALVIVAVIWFISVTISLGVLALKWVLFDAPFLNMNLWIVLIITFWVSMSLAWFCKPLHAEAAKNHLKLLKQKLGEQRIMMSVIHGSKVRMNNMVSIVFILSILRDKNTDQQKQWIRNSMCTVHIDMPQDSLPDRVVTVSYITDEIIDEALDLINNHPMHTQNIERILEIHEHIIDTMIENMHDMIHDTNQRILHIENMYKDYL